MKTLAILALTPAVMIGDWRSLEFQKAKAQLDSARERKGGQGLILDLKRVSSTRISGYGEVRGQGIFDLYAVPSSNNRKDGKPIEILTWNFDGSFSQARPIPIEFSIPENALEVNFVMRSKKNGELMWSKALPTLDGAHQIFVFYIPGMN